MKKRLTIVAFVLFILVGSTATFVKIETEHSCCESPTVRWKFGIYCGECDDETGCHYTPVPNTGILEYFGIRAIPCENN